MLTKLVSLFLSCFMSTVLTRAHHSSSVKHTPTHTATTSTSMIHTKSNETIIISNKSAVFFLLLFIFIFVLMMCMYSNYQSMIQVRSSLLLVLPVNVNCVNCVNTEVHCTLYKRGRRYATLQCYNILFNSTIVEIAISVKLSAYGK